MTPEDLYGRHARDIFLDGECWIWTGRTKSGVPTCKMDADQPVIRHGMKALGEKSVDKLVMSCERRLCVNPEHVVYSQSDVGRMLYIKERAIPEGDCLVWKGQVSHGIPTFSMKNATGHSNLSVRAFVWSVEHIPAGFPAPTGRYYTTTCDTLLCVSHEHIVEKETDRGD